MASTAWYRTGTIALVQNSATVTGTGTQWNNPVYGVAPGQMLLVPGAGTVVMYEIQRVVSDTQITLATPYTGSAATGQQYAIVTALVGSVADFSRQLSVLVSQWQSQLDGWQQILSGTGDVKLTAPDGSTVTVKSQAALTAAINDTLNKSTTMTQTVASAVEFKKNITSNGDQQMRATSTTPNLLLRFRDINDVEKGAVFSDTSTGNMTIRWNGTAYSINAKADGSVTFPGPLYSNNSQVATRATPLGTSDLNTIKTEGAYYQGSNANATATLNYPANSAGSLIVIDSHVGSTGNSCVTQKYYLYRFSELYYQRSFDGTNWTAWEVFDSRRNNDARYLKIGDFGVGGLGAIKSFTADTDLKDFIRSASTGSQILRNNEVTGLLPRYAAAILLKVADTWSLWSAGTLARGVRVAVGNTAGGQDEVYEIWTDRNTTVDSNGFIKKASPIIRLSNAPEKMAADYLSGFTLAGVGAVNGEAAGVSAQRLATGIYQITGSLGLATEGWQIEIPQDTNGNRLVFASTEVDEDGTIRVYTHKRRFDPESAMVVAGEPMDIPEGRWIDLRLSMPAQPEPEIVEPEEVQPESEVDAESTTDNNAE
ncbi:pyocin knob domain-containing protein [Serratia oryzae]|uniref:pyocin knob domain-containing protein n=1 Tax=Serratia oryzae TaxID=2034155 RepID=UPI0012E1FFF4|nr:pyocin knob domain-containing protein [Serratia oryzae]